LVESANSGQSPSAGEIAEVQIDLARGQMSASSFGTPASKYSFSGSRSSSYTKKKATVDYADMTHYKARDWHAFLIAPTAIKVSRKKFHVL